MIRNDNGLIGKNTVDITSTVINAHSHVFITPTIQTTNVLSVTSVANGKFTVTIPSITPADLPFNWWVVNESK